MSHPFLAEFQANLLQTFQWLERELAGLRTGRASPALIEHLPVACYGGISPLQEVASINSPEPQVLVVQPFDPGIIKDIEKSLQQSSLGISPVVESKVIRLPFPPMTQERRQELSKVVKDRGEQARVRVRTNRETVLKLLRLAERNGELSEDTLQSSEKELQQAVEQAGLEIESVTNKKMTEVTTV